MKKILIVDDEEDFCYFVKKNLEMRGNFKVDICVDSTNALFLAKTFHPDLILLDVNMPNKGGSEVAEELKESEDTKNIPVVFVTAIVKEAELKNQGNILGGRYFFAKPIKTNELIDLINMLTGSK